MYINISRGKRASNVSAILRKHFGAKDLGSLNVAQREFPYRVRADLQNASDALFNNDPGVVRFLSLRMEIAFEGLSLAAIATDAGRSRVFITPPEYEEIDVGEDKPVRCLKVGLWLLRWEAEPVAVLLSPAIQHGRQEGIGFQVATLNNEHGAAISAEIFQKFESAVQAGRSYRGKILSLEAERSYTGKSTGIKVHKLRTVSRVQVILPERTLRLLDRNVIQFVQRRERLGALGQATKKGILFYGPPGTGKSHTIHYLAGALKGHTMLLILAEQVGLLQEYMALARLLQPSVVVIEDVDLIGRDRAEMGSPCEEALLNKLLNEMDGLRENADILFILTTNRPEMLEPALASRPGRVDQAIEFPLPDDVGREKLVHLYGGGAVLSDDLVRLVVNRTDQVSAAFIKELMRRSVQFQLERDGAGELISQDIENALDEMLFSGGSLNLKLLGGKRAAPPGLP